LRNHGEQGELSADRKRGLGLVQQVEPLTAKPVLGECQEGLAVRLLVEGQVPIERQVGRVDAATVDECGNVEEALSPQEVAVARLRAAEDRLKAATEHRSWPRREFS